MWRAPQLCGPLWLSCLAQHTPPRGKHPPALRLLIACGGFATLGTEKRIVDAFGVLNDVQGLYLSKKHHRALAGGTGRIVCILHPLGMSTNLGDTRALIRPDRFVRRPTERTKHQLMRWQAFNLYITPIGA